MSNPDQTPVMSVEAELVDRVFKQGMEKQRSFYTENYINTLASDAFSEAISALQALRRSDMEAVIGEDELYKRWEVDCKCGATHEYNNEPDKRNQLRAEQRTIMEDRLRWNDTDHDE